MLIEINFYFMKNKKSPKVSFLKEFSIFENNEFVVKINNISFTKENIFDLIDKEILEKSLIRQWNKIKTPHFSNIRFDISEETAFYFQLKHGNDFLKCIKISE